MAKVNRKLGRGDKYLDLMDNQMPCFATFGLHKLRAI